MSYDRAVLAGAVVGEMLRTTTTARGRAYDVVAHQQAAMPEQLLAPPAADPEHDDQEPEAGQREAIGFVSELWVLAQILGSRRGASPRCAIVRGWFA
ncbi:hypothetical protein ABZ934_31930 [Streptomyces sp. NPDC046557]|uniref:hypothetical protein n=1 Tax=Streptomyces sp. NPDC046557 TaxID=3155372 RepID=UPI0033D0C04A